ncbi:tRNA-modifying protein ygfZ [Leminorella richardii]|uniref:tRNA-modifying protein YgfZ n=1 Tax=Leminorella richardii TaxID=158841 RepID=A0A2X4UK28_9GAMM|nr:tRNA-modifying protein YgfZ [Leminorella richardii]SQI35968.1 tRNA-modifying protein ygfZ [Leminorella richardii]
MMYTSPLPSQLASTSLHLPLTLMSLEDWALVTVTGEDARKYLQGQITADVFALGDQQHTLSAHCDAKGKTWSALRLFHRGDSLAYLQRASVCERQVTELKKYAVFSKVTIARDDAALLLGLAGTGARDALGALYSTLPDAQSPSVTVDNTTLLYFSAPSERFLIVAPQAQADRLYSSLLGKAALNDSRQWLALDIEAGLPIIDDAVAGEFLPQGVNLQALDAISFTKGCYTGQEMVARAKYRGANRRAMYWLEGKALTQPAVGDELELQLGENWRRTGTVLSSVRLTDDSLRLQAVLNSDLEHDAVLRVRDDATSQLAICPLPYSLEEAE